VGRGGDENGGPIRRVRLEGGPVAVPAKVLAAIEAVRDSGATNMLDRNRVIEIARAFGTDDAADWIEAHRSEYANGIFRGFVADDGPGAAM
jgi:hypothetical protein